MDTPVVKRGRGRPPKSAQPTEGQPDGRDFQCQMCGKSYLSNPALYLHMKLKHVQALPQSGVNSTATGEKKNRGRPRKIPGPYDGMGSSAGGSNFNGRVDPTHDNFMKSEDKAGGPTNPLTGFEECAQQIYENEHSLKSYATNYTSHPMYDYLYRYSHNVTPMGGAADEPAELRTKPLKDVNREIQLLSETKKNMMNCDQIFTLYLREYAQVQNPTFYGQKFLKFVLFFRDCLNQFGWQKRAENECKEFFGKPEYDGKVKERLESFESMKQTSEFTAINNAEFAPEIANEFVTIFFDDHMQGQLTRADVIDFTQHLCYWLFQQKMTCSKLSMVNG